MTNFKSTRTTLVAALLMLLAFAPAAAAITVERGSGGIDPSGGGGGGQTGGGAGGTETAPTSDGVFPVAGKVTWGDGLGAGRGHQGQDLMAKCGKPLVAAQGGKVRVNDVHSAAGNYLVIKSKTSRMDHVYMHMIAPSKLQEGDRVRTGQRIGRVGTTGNSSACHLHFEVWSAPGWYNGGSVIDPVPHLRSWQRSSR